MKMKKSAKAPRYPLSKASEGAQSRNKTSCGPRIYTIKIRVQETEILAELPGSQGIDNWIDLESKRFRMLNFIKKLKREIKNFKIYREVICTNHKLSKDTTLGPI